MANPFSNFKSAMEWRRSGYDDGLDADGYPAEHEPWRKPYVHGSEADVGEFKPITLSGALQNVVDRAAAAVKIGDSTESPIEHQIGAAIFMFFDRSGHPLRICLEWDEKRPPDALLLVPQFKWSYYRSDWAILNPSREGALLIECDGKEFHSTPEQRAHDKRKDAAALDRGFLTMRFTGSQIFRGADECAQKVYDALFGGT